MRFLKVEVKVGLLKGRGKGWIPKGKSKAGSMGWVVGLDCVKLG